MEEAESFPLLGVQLLSEPCDSFKSTPPSLHTFPLLCPVPSYRMTPSALFRTGSQSWRSLEPEKGELNYNQLNSISFCFVLFVSRHIAKS